MKKTYFSKTVWDNLEKFETGANETDLLILGKGIMVLLLESWQAHTLTIRIIFNQVQYELKWFWFSSSVFFVNPTWIKICILVFQYVPGKSKVIMFGRLWNKIIWPIFQTEMLSYQANANLDVKDGGKEFL